MIRARGGEQYRLGVRSERLGGARQEHMTDRLRAGRAAGLAAYHHAETKCLELAGKPRGLRGLAAPLAAFERDEFAFSHLVAMQIFLVKSCGKPVPTFPGIPP